MPTRRGVRTAFAAAASLAVLAPLAWFWASSLVPGAYSVTDLGYADHGGGPAHHAGVSVPVDALVPPAGAAPDVSVVLTAEQGPFTLPSGRRVEGYSVNGSSPGPVIEAEQGQLVEVRLVNESVGDGVTLHWHGVDVPGGMDGVAGVTQNAVAVGEEFTYRFYADRAGTYWYHSHQVAHEQVRGGLFGALVVAPAAEARPVEVDALAVVHLFPGGRTVNGLDEDTAVAAAPGDRVRVRVVNTDAGPMQTWVEGAPFRLAAVDGTDLAGPEEVEDVSVTVTAGGRADLEFTVPEGGARVGLGGADLLFGDAPDEPGPVPAAILDPLHYGTAPPAPALSAEDADRVFEYAIGRRPGFLDGRPGLWWTVNGGLYPDVPMYTVAEGDLVVMRIANGSGEVHPMHLHGHHALVLSRDGVAATGSPWWIDSLNVADDEEYEIAFTADNPGIWMDHCHNLSHVLEGLSAHLMYEGVSTPFTVGGDHGNHLE
ncbi:multicopper oxidase family protein [Glycomyces terrestris]|uniref:Multicopper oxidase family protein n=1 Tax=Glycomyces terrestris TaxID=2493553 RepID=A0A426UWQ5_9ACTN|nr:multicopper oxidase family protein [Glycomyces terrestris]RRR98633.1 multicopper oxidase family protein [Glycomyces terrestris]